MAMKFKKSVLEVIPLAGNESKLEEEFPLELVAQQAELPRGLLGAVIGTLNSLDGSGKPLVDFPARHRGKPLPARSTVVLGSKDIGGEVVLLFEQNDPRKPIVIGLIDQSARSQSPSAASQRDVELDGDRLVLTADKEIVLRCGEATIVLTRAGKILIRGAYLLNHSSGVNRIKGGSVQIN